MLTTLLKHYGGFVHSSEVDDLELAKIDGNGLRARRAARHKSLGAARNDDPAVPFSDGSAEEFSG